MSMERRSESYSGRTGYGSGGSAGGGGGSSYDDPYQMKRRSESYHGPRTYGSTSMPSGGQHEDPYQLKRYKSSKSKSWDLGMQDPEMKRKKRVASYKVYTVEGKVKATFRSSLRWIKNKYIDIRYGWW